MRIGRIVELNSIRGNNLAIAAARIGGTILRFRRHGGQRLRLNRLTGLMTMATASAAMGRFRRRLLNLNGHLVGEQRMMPTTSQHRVQG